MNTPIKLAPAIALALGVASPCLHAAALPIGARLTITQGVATTSNGVNTSVTGSYFGMDTGGNSRMAESEKTVLGQGTTGIIVGATTTAGASHSGAPTGGDTNAIDDPWNFFGNTGSDFASTAITGSTAGMVMSGWRVTWNGIPSINMSTGAWNPLNCVALDISVCSFSNGVGQLIWNGTSGGAYRLIYAATVPVGDLSGFGGVKYLLNLIGTVQNDAPTISVPNFSALPSTLQTFSVTAADANPSTGVANTNLTCSIGSQGGTGTATVRANCSSGSYTDTSGAPGSDSFTVVVSDGLDTATDTVNVTVSATPAPNASDFTANAVDTTPATIDFTPNVSILGGGTIDWTTLAVNCASGAGITNNNDGTIDYAGVAGFSGADACTYTVDDLLAQTSNSATLSVSVYGTGVGSSAGTLSGGTTTSVPADADVGTQCVGGCFDFTVSGIGVGTSVQVVLPLSRTIPADALYRKYMTGSGWQNFVEDADNAVASAASTTILGTAVCPPPGDASYLPGLAVGDDCVQLTILDGGPNDDDATPGQIADPSGIATPAAAIIGGASGGGGCVLSNRTVSIGAGGDWLLVGAALAGLGLFRRRVF